MRTCACAFFQGLVKGQGLAEGLHRGGTDAHKYSLSCGSFFGF